MPLDDLIGEADRLLAAAEGARDGAKALERDAHTVLKDLRHATADARRVHDQLEARLAEVPDWIDDQIKARIYDHLRAMSQECVTTFMEEQKAAVNLAHRQVMAGFTEIVTTIIGMDEKRRLKSPIPGGRSVTEVLDDLLDKFAQSLPESTDGVPEFHPGETIAELTPPFDTNTGA